MGCFSELKQHKRAFFFSALFPGLYPPRAKLAIQKYLSQLTDNEQVEIFERVQVRFAGVQRHHTYRCINTVFWQLISMNFD